MWLYDSSLLVGHHPSALTENRTLDSLYLSPLTSIIEKQNPSSPYITGNPTRWGVFDTAPDQTLFLWIDMKTAGNETFDAVVEALEPMRKKGWLTTHDGKTLQKGPITVIGTGSTPRARVEAQSPRFVFYDAPLGRLGEDTNKNITSAVSLIASTSLKSVVGDVIGDGLSESQLVKVRAQIKEAADKGIGARYWETPWWPTHRRNNVWKQLVNEGVALLGVDEVQVAANWL